MHADAAEKRATQTYARGIGDVKKVLKLEADAKRRDSQEIFGSARRSQLRESLEEFRRKMNMVAFSMAATG